MAKLQWYPIQGFLKDQEYKNVKRKHLLSVLSNDNKQLLDEVEHDIMNYQNQGLCYLPKPEAEADNTDTTV